MIEEERHCCMRCGVRTIPAHLQRVALPGGELRFCYLCCNEFWAWMSSRATHSECEPTVPTAKGLALGSCLVCRCELDRWLKPLYTSAAAGQESAPKVPAQSPAPAPKEAASPAERKA